MNSFVGKRFPPAGDFKKEKPSPRGFSPPKGRNSKEKGDENVTREDATWILECFGFQYQKEIGKPHPQVGYTTIKRLQDACGEYGIDTDGCLKMIDTYFRTAFGANCDYRIWHFLANGVFVRCGLHAGVIHSIHAPARPPEPQALPKMHRSAY